MSLSDKIITMTVGGYLNVEDVREAAKELKGKIVTTNFDDWALWKSDIEEIINNVFGEKLK